MQNFPCTPNEMFQSLWRNRSLIKTLVKREVLGRYKGSLFGILWSFFNPILMLFVYTFVFSVIFKMKWGGGSDSRAEFALIIFSGLIIFNLFSECFNRSATLILANANYVKKVVFPLEILPIVSLGSAIFHSAISYLVWFLAYFIFCGIPHFTAILMPLVMIPLIFFILGVTWIFSSLGVYLRDIAQLTGPLTTIIMFLSPIFYPISALPEEFQVYLRLNPLAPVLEQARQVMFWGVIPDYFQYLVCLIIALISACLGFMCFQKARRGFADVI